VSIERRGDPNFDIAVGAGSGLGEAREVALHVRAEGEEIGDYDDALCAACDQQSSCAGKIRLAKFEERSFNRVSARSSHFGNHIAHGLIGAFDARSVGEDDESGHTWCFQTWINEAGGAMLSGF
jgi:hypothetical protein